MRTLAFLILFLPTQVMALAPECPLYASKKECLNSVGDNYEDFLDFIEHEDQRDELILVANDIKYYETLACQKTCVQ